MPAQRWALFALVALLGLAIFLGLRSRTDAPQQNEICTLVLGTSEEPRTLDPAFVRSAAAREISTLLYRDLLVFDQDWRRRADLADGLPKVSTATEGTDVAWRLRPGLRWSDGQPITSRDVEKGYQVRTDKRWEALSSDLVEQVLAFHRQDERSFRFTWRTFGQDQLSPGLHTILPAHAYPKPEPKKPFLGLQRASVSNGPYRLLEWKPGQSLTLERNPHWSGPKPNIPRITYRFFPSEDAFEAELRTGGIHALGEASRLSLARGDALGKTLRASHEVHYRPTGSWVNLVVAPEHPALDSVLVRRAISRALDRAVLSKIMYGGRASPAYGIYPGPHPGHSSEAVSQAETALGYSEEKARALVQKAQAAKIPTEAPMVLMVASESQAARRGAAYIQAQAQKVGLQIVIRSLPFSVMRQKLRDRSFGGLLLFAWRSRPDWAAASVLGSEGTHNYRGYRNPEVDALLQKARDIADQNAWGKTLAAIERIYVRDLPTIPLLFRATISVRPKKLEGWRPTGTSTPVTWNAEHWMYCR